MQRLVEIRAYLLKPGVADAFHRDFVEVVVPMLRSWGTEVVAHGSSAHASDAYFLIRAYAGVDDRQARQDAFYGSEAWRNGPREAVVGRIEQSLDTVLWLDAETIDDLRRGNRPPQ